LSKQKDKQSPKNTASIKSFAFSTEERKCNYS